MAQSVTERAIAYNLAHDDDLPAEQRQWMKDLLPLTTLEPYHTNFASYCLANLPPALQQALSAAR